MKYSQVEGMFLQIRDIVINEKKPRRVELNNNLIRYNSSTIEPALYPECFESIAASYVDRFPPTREGLETIIQEWQKTSQYLRVQQ